MARKSQAAAPRAPRRSEAPAPTSRRDKALATRRRVLQAAYELFCERGFVAATMPLIAERAGVAVQTLYFTFSTKAAILEETVGAAIVGFDRWDPRIEQDVAADPREAFARLHAWFLAFDAAPTQAAALEVFVAASLAILERVGPLVLAAAAAVATDPQVQRSAEVGEQRRVEGYRFVVERLAKRGKLKKGVTQRRATDILLTVLSAETHQMLAVRRGWSSAECRRFMLDVLEHQLLDPETARR